MSNFSPRIFSGYVGMYGLPPFPLDLRWPCDEPAAPIEQREPPANPIRHETIRQAFWLYRQGTTRPAPFGFNANTIAQDFFTNGSPSGLNQHNYWRYFGPPVDTAGNTLGFSLYYSIRKLNNLFSFTWNVGLNGIFKSNGGTSGQDLSVEFWNGNNAWVGKTTSTALTWPNPTSAGTIRGWIITLDKQANQFIVTRCVTGNLLFEQTFTLPTSAFASSWTLMSLLTDSALGIGDMHAWRYPLARNQRVVVGQRLMGTTSTS